MFCRNDLLVKENKEDRKEEMEIIELPPELMFKIILFLDLPDVVQFYLSSKYLSEFCGDRLWIELIKRDFQLTPPDIQERANQKGSLCDCSPYLQLYQDLIKHRNLVKIINYPVSLARKEENRMLSQLDNRSSSPKGMSAIKYQIESSIKIQIDEITPLRCDIINLSKWKNHINRNYSEILYGSSGSLVNSITPFKIVSINCHLYMVFKVLESNQFVRVNHFFLYLSLNDEYELDDFLSASPDRIISTGYVHQIRHTNKGGEE